MNIIHFTGMRSNKLGGLEKFFLELANQIEPFNGKLILVYEEMPTTKAYLELLKERGVKIELIKFMNNSVLSSSRSVVKILKNYKPKIIHTHFDPASSIVLLVAWLLGYKIRIKNLRSMLNNENGVAVKQKSGLSYKTRVLKKIMYKLSTQIYTVSDGIKKQFIEVFNIINHRKIKSLYVGVEKSNITETEKLEIKKELGLSDNLIIISCVAFHDKVKGIDILLRAIDLINYRKGDLEYKVLLVGSGKPENTRYLKGLANQLNLNNKILWLGNRNDVNKLLSISDIYCQPSRSEGISLALMEAAMTGVSLLGTRTGGIPEIIEHNKTGLLVDVEDYESLSYKLERLIEDKSLRNILGDNAKNKALRQFDLKKQVVVLVCVYKTLMKIS